MSRTQVLIAPNAFKESLSATKVAESIAAGFKKVLPAENIILLPIADGGDGSVEILSDYLNLKTKIYSTVDPLGREISSAVSFSEENEAFIEMASASGLHLLSDDEKDAGTSSSYGTGILMRSALEEKDLQIINLFVGGTASMDMGTGILQALGFKFIDKEGNEVNPAGSNLANIREIFPPEGKKVIDPEKTRIRIFCDVENPLTGENGAVNVFAPQKDNGSTNMAFLEKSFESFAHLLKVKTGRDISEFPGGGAAGGAPAGLSAFFDVEILRGAEKILDFCDFDEHLEKADLVITAEGKLDNQSMSGKAPIIIANRTRKKGKSIIFIGGNIPDDPADKSYELFDAVFSIIPAPVPLKDAMANSARWLERLAYNIAVLIGKM